MTQEKSEIKASVNKPNCIPARILCFFFKVKSEPISNDSTKLKITEQRMQQANKPMAINSQMETLDAPWDLMSLSTATHPDPAKKLTLIIHLLH